MEQEKVGMETETPIQPLEMSNDTQNEETKVAEAKAEADELTRKESQLANVNKAIAEANEDLRKIREAKKAVRNTKVQKPEEVDDFLSNQYQIDLEDPNSKAWDNHIRQNVAPIEAELEKEKEEIRTYALQEFLKDKPALASSSEKIKEVVEIYEKIRTASERTKEGVITDLKKAYAAVYHEQLINDANLERVNKAKADIAFSEVAVSKGSTSYGSQKEVTPKLSEDDKKTLAKWGIPPEVWTEEFKQTRSKE